MGGLAGLRSVSAEGGEVRGCPGKASPATALLPLLCFQGNVTSFWPCGFCKSNVSVLSEVLVQKGSARSCSPSAFKKENAFPQLLLGACRASTCSHACDCQTWSPAHPGISPGVLL